MSKTIIKAYTDKAGSSIGVTDLESDSFKVDQISDKAGTGAPDMVNGIKLSGGSDVLSVYEKGTFTISALVSAGNFLDTAGGALTLGDLTIGDLEYTRIGDTVFCHIGEITGFEPSSVTGFNNLHFTLSGLPTVSDEFYGSVGLFGTSYYNGSVTKAGSGALQVNFDLGNASIGEHLTITSINFHYHTS